MDSLYATCGLPTVAPTLNSRSIRSTRISRWSSPIPDDDRLARLRVGPHAERGVFLAQLVEGLGKLVLVGFGLRFDRDRHHRFGEVHRLEHDRMLDVANRVACPRLPQPHDRSDIARIDRVLLLALVRVHLNEPSEPLFVARRDVEMRAALLRHAAVHADVRELPDVGIRLDLEYERGKRLIVAAFPRFRASSCAG